MIWGATLAGVTKIISTNFDQVSRQTRMCLCVDCACACVCGVFGRFSSCLWLRDLSPILTSITAFQWLESNACWQC